MGKLDHLLWGNSGYFRNGCEDDFPWDTTGQGVWYSLLVHEGTEIVKYGFTSAKGQKECLIDALKSLEGDEGALLLGVWSGRYNTHLFDLNIKKAINKLKSVV